MKKTRFFISVIFMVMCATLSLAQKWTNYRKEDSGLASNKVRAICIDNNGVKWFGTDNGLARFDGISWTTYTTDDSLAHNSVHAIAFEVTKYGPEIWVATDGGVSVISVVPDAITFATPYRKANTGLVSDTVFTAAVDTSHVKWFGTDSGISTFNGTDWATFTSEDVLTYDRIMTIFPSEQDRLIYYGTEGSGSGLFDGISEATPWDTRWSGIASDNVYAIYIDSEGSQWFGTDQGLSHHFGSKMKDNWTIFTTEDGLADNFVHSIIEDSNGAKWFGTSNGVSSFDGISWKTFTQDDGLVGNTVYAIAVDTDGSLWFGTENGVSNLNFSPVLVETDRTEAFAIRGIYPNPFNMQTTLEFTLPETGYTTVTVYNMTGQKVRELLNSLLMPGIHTVTWDGIDDNGLNVSSGLYFTRISSGSNVITGRMVLVK